MAIQDRQPEIDHHQDHLRRIAVLGAIDQKTGLPMWAVDDSEIVKTAGEAAVLLYEELAKLEATRARTEGNGDLTRAGKDNRIKQAAIAFVKVDVAITESRRDALTREAQRARGVLAMPEPEGDAIIRELRASEIRRRFEGLGQLEVDGVALEAVARDDTETLHAIMNPPGPALLSEEGRRRAEAAFFKGNRAEEMARAERLESAARSLDALIASARSRAVQLGAENADPIRVAAAG